MLEGYKIFCCDNHNFNPSRLNMLKWTMQRCQTCTAGFVDKVMRQECPCCRLNEVAEVAPWKDDQKTIAPSPQVTTLSTSLVEPTTPTKPRQLRRPGTWRQLPNGGYLEFNHDTQAWVPALQNPFVDRPTSSFSALHTTNHEFVRWSSV